MRVLQLIDSLDGGGAERVAVNLANALGDSIVLSALCTTRKEGILKSKLHPEVRYLFLNKKRSVDIGALKRLKRFVKQHDIEIIHAHATSFFFASLLKFIYPKLKIVWHEHLGSRVNTKRANNLALYFCSFFFQSILTVNADLQQWATRYLRTKNVAYLPNFVSISDFTAKQVKRGDRIVCLANLRKPKNHINLVTAFSEVSANYPSWNLHLIGNDYGDIYSQELRSFISAKKLENRVLIKGVSRTIETDLLGFRIGVLASDSEGLPMSLLEYGAAGLAVIATDVGYCKEVVAETGILVPPKNSVLLAEALDFLIRENEKRKEAAILFHNRVVSNYSIDAVLPILLKIYTN